MRTKKYISLIIMVMVVILELLPYGAVLNFGRPPEEGGVWRETYSYFSLTPFGYANFGPFLTAMLSVVILLHILVSVLFKTDKLWKGVKVEAAIASVLSLLPVVYGFEYYTGIGFAITILLVITFFITSMKGANNDEK